MRKSRMIENSRNWLVSTPSGLRTHMGITPVRTMRVTSQTFRTLQHQTHPSDSMRATTSRMKRPVNTCSMVSKIGGVASPSSTDAWMPIMTAFTAIRKPMTSSKLTEETTK